jgi:hypothetical protein
MKSLLDKYQHTEVGDVMPGETVEYPSEHDYYLEGKAAKLQGKAINDCPYAPISIRGNKWLKGYADG